MFKRKLFSNIKTEKAHIALIKMQITLKNMAAAYNTLLYYSIQGKIREIKCFHELGTKFVTCGRR